VKTLGIDISPAEGGAVDENKLSLIVVAGALVGGVT
jgi:hypothetical protein